MTSSRFSSLTLPPDVEQKLESICDEFQTAWNAGTGPPVEAFVQRVEEPYRSVLQRELQALEHRLGQTAVPNPDEAPGDTDGPFDVDQTRTGWVIRASAGPVPRQIGRYAVRRVLGEGAFGRVLLAEDTGTWVNGATTSSATIWRTGPLIRSDPMKTRFG